MPDPTPLLDPIEARILGVLMEKEKTTPDVYPLTVNSLLSGCNQKTSRDPVMALTEAQVQSALDALRSRMLVIDSYGASGRVLRYAHNFRKVYALPAGSAALLATLMLRGPQTVSELRANCDRLHAFADASTAEAFLDELAERTAGALVLKLPKQPGSREHRWAHLLCGAPVFEAASARAAQMPSELEERVARLEAEVEQLRAEVAALGARD